MNVRNVLIGVILISFCITVSACGGKKVYQLNLLKTPTVYSSGLVNPFTGKDQIEKMPYGGILYATDRKPATEADEDQFYTATPGLVLRLGVGDIRIGDGKMTREEAVSVSLIKTRTRKYPLSVASIEEFGILERSRNMFMDVKEYATLKHNGGVKYADLINKKLEISETQKDIFIFVHGYNTNFEDPLLVATELWHYLGYEGVFIAYSWPATVRRMAYWGDLEKAKMASRNLRLFIEYLSEKTNVENIHILGYSMGTRVTIDAIADLALLNAKKSPAKIRKNIRIGNVIIVGSGLSYTFSKYLHDDILNVTKYLTIYMSSEDTALGASNWLFDRRRVGQFDENYNYSESQLNYLRRTPKLRFIDVTNAEAPTEGNGHHYFRNSPWVSSDLLMTLMFDLPPEKRGLVLDEQGVTWEFTNDYEERLKAYLGKAEFER